MQVCCFSQMHHFVMHAKRNCVSCCVSRSRHPFSLLSCDVGCFIVTQSHSIKVSRWSALVIFSSFRASVVLSRSLCQFLLIEPIFCGLWQCWSKFCWFDCFSRLVFHFLQILVWRIRWYHHPIFFFGLPIRSVCPISWTQIWVPFSSLFQPSFTRWCCWFSVPNFHFDSFVGPVPASNLCAFHLFHGFFSASLYVCHPVFFFNHMWYQFHRRASSSNETSLSTTILNPCATDRLRIHHQCYTFQWCPLSPFSSLGPISCFSIFLYFHFVWIMSRSILRCVDWIILSCSLFGAHFPAA